jgi:hypothetical protein
MIMFALSNIQHCIIILRRVVHQVRGLVGVHFSLENNPTWWLEVTYKHNYEICTKFIFQNKNCTYGRGRNLGLLQIEARLAFRIKKDSHRHDQINYSCPHVNTHIGKLHSQCEWPSYNINSYDAWIWSMAMLKSLKFFTNPYEDVV